ncbi:MAG: hypothetical protein HC945_02285 [Nitrosarchaeum sp.]|nr:hypothetical protein [Nitrosarchaeum sp.]
MKAKRATDKERRPQESYVRMHIIAKEIEQIEEQLRSVQRQTQDAEGTLAAIHELQRLSTAASTDEEVLLPVANGIYIQARAQHPLTLIMNMGRGVCIKQTPDQAHQLIQNHVKALEQTHHSLSEALQQRITQAHTLERDLRST